MMSLSREEPMRTSRYLNAVLTIIALELGWLALTYSAAPVAAQPAPTRVVIAGVDLPRDQMLPILLRGSELSSGLPVAAVGQVEIHAASPIRIEAARPLPVEAPNPIPVRIPVSTSPVPGL